MTGWKNASGSPVTTKEFVRWAALVERGVVGKEIDSVGGDMACSCFVVVVIVG